MDLQNHIDALRTAVASSGVTHAGLADLSGGVLTHSWVSKFARGVMHNPQAKSLIALSDALDRAKGAAPADVPRKPGHRKASNSAREAQGAA